MQYQLKIQQLVTYAKSRVYRNFIRALSDNENIRLNGESNLFYFMTLCSYANFRTSTFCIDAMRYTIAPGEWLMPVRELMEIYRKKTEKGTIAVLERLQQSNYIRYELLHHRRYVKFKINDWSKFNSTIEATAPCTKDSGFFFFPYKMVAEFIGKGKCSEMDILLDLWLNAIYNDERIAGSDVGPVVYYGDMTRRQSKIIGNMLGCEIDFIIKGMDQQSRSIIASRKEAMEKKRQTFFLSTNPDGSYQIYEGRIVQARVVAVAEKVIRVEVFGVECSIYARDLSWDWVGDCHDHYNVGDKILVRVLQVDREDSERIKLKVDVRSVQESDAKEKLSRCKLQAKYAGTVTDVNNGTMYIRLSNGVNAIARTCYDNRMPGKKDEVSFVLTKIDAEHHVAMGIVTRIIRQNG